MKMTKYTIALFIIFITVANAELTFELVPKTGVYYDSNPFALSGEIDDFPLEIEGDVKYNMSLNLKTRLVRFSGNSVKPSFEIGFTGYGKNTQKNFLSLQPKVLLIRKGFWVSGLYRYIPRYSIRPVKDAEDDYIYKFPEYVSNKFKIRSALRVYDKLG